MTDTRICGAVVLRPTEGATLGAIIVLRGATHAAHCTKKWRVVPVPHRWRPIPLSEIMPLAAEHSRQRAKASLAT